MSIKIDFTSSFDALTSFENWLEINGEDTLKYVFKHREKYSLESFVEYFNIKDQDILKDVLLVASLHVTTNNDNCKSIKELGFLSLQEAIKAVTPLSDYLKEQGIVIDLQNKKVEYRGNTFDISKRTDYAMPGSREGDRNLVIGKLYNDYQINGFYCTPNALKYGGGVRYRPEILASLAGMLSNAAIEHDWIKKSKCYVLKYFADLSDFTYYTFNLDVRDISEYEENKEEYELHKRKWLLKKALAVVFDNMYSYRIPEEYSYCNYTTKIPLSNIEIFTEAEYKKQYKIEE